MQADYDLFSCTIKKNVKKEDVSTVKPSTYEEVILKLKSLGVQFTYINYEDDTKGCCHVHCVASIKKGVYRKDLLKHVSPFHIRLDKIYDLKGWVKYAMKNQSIFKKADEEARAGFTNSYTVSPIDDDTPIDDEYTFKIPTRSMFKRT